jgi:hypothetical protein
MISRIHAKLGTAGFIIALVALIAALAGTAFAAAGLNTKQKKEVKKIAKQVAKQVLTPGPQGPAGSAGPAGSPGAPGKEGAQGHVGTAGADGEDGACSASLPNCVLPANATLTGDWSFVARGSETFETEVGGTTTSHTLGVAGTFLNISFPLRIPSVVDGGGEPKFNPDVNWIGEGGSSTAQCPGTAADPEAAPGQVCLYAERLSGVNGLPSGANSYTADPASGLVVELALEAGVEAYGYGSWAVTAAEE